MRKKRDLADAKIVDALHGRAAITADQSVAISTDQRIGDRFGACRTVEIGASFPDPGRMRFWHAGIMSLKARTGKYARKNRTVLDCFFGRLQVSASSGRKVFNRN